MAIFSYLLTPIKSKYPIKCLLLSRRTLFLCVARPFKEDYDKLGVKPNATKREIKAAYFEKAKQLHPDTSGKESDEFNEINEAYKRLVSEEGHKLKHKDPHNDPQMREYWENRRRNRERIRFDYEEDFAKRFAPGSRDQQTMRKLRMVFLVAVFFWVFMVSYPIVKMMSGHPHGCRCEKCFGILNGHHYTQGCRCERCSLILLQSNPTTAELLGFKK